jgi:hypothetical protein
MRYLISLLFSFSALESFSQEYIIDTLYPYSIIKDSISTKRFQVLFSNSNMTYFATGKSALRVVENAIKKNQPISFNYSESRAEINSLKIIDFSDLEKFLDFYDTLEFRGFKFNKDISFERNKRLLDFEVIRLEKALRDTISLDSAKVIFQFLISQSCENVNKCERDNPCIPYDYKTNGCNARAHWMKKLLNEKFNIECKKIFTEGNLVAVNGGNCGKKCVFWGWHVAILLYVRNSDDTISEVVLDPSLFNRLVSKDEWIKAQEMLCTTSRKGKVKSISIEPSFVYTPNGSTDPEYIDTKRLIGKFCKNCH